MLDHQPAAFDPNWQERYRERLATPQAAAARLHPGQRVFIGTGCAQPLALVRAVAARAGQLADLEFVHLLTIGEAPYARPELAPYFQVNSFFLAENVRDFIQAGYGSYTPVFLSDIPRLFRSGQMPLDVALIQVSPPDRRGRCSLGISVDVVKSAAESAGLVIAQVNPNMPRTLGDSFIDADDLDWLVPVDEPLGEVTPQPSDPESQAVACNVAALVEDGSTLELGIGRIPQAVLEHLRERRDLGIHTEMLTDAVVDLVAAGAVSGVRKSMDQGRIVVSFCLGSRRLYDFVHNNPLFSFRPTEYVNDPFVIGRQHRMVAINVALAVDLTGQVCADAVEGRFYSGFGGQVDFNRGASRAEGGRAIIALPSTAQEGRCSRIVARHEAGAGVVTTRGDIHYVVTEYGVAYLHGKSVPQRALALIAIAHPRFRPQLLREAVEARFLRPELATVGERLALGSAELRTSMVLKDGVRIDFRPVHPTDEERLRELFYTLSSQTVYRRFMRQLKWLSVDQLQEFVYIDHRNAVALVGTLPAVNGEELVAMGGYYLDPVTNRAEVAFLVKDTWQRRGIGRFMLSFLVTTARRQGIAGFTATVLPENKPMQAVFRNSGLRVRSRQEEGVVHFELKFA